MLGSRARVYSLCLLLTACQASPQDFTPTDPFASGVAEPGALSPGVALPPFHAAVIRARTVGSFGVDLWRGEVDPGSAERTPPALRLPLFSDASYDARLVRVRRVGDADVGRSLVWEGELVGHPDSAVTLLARADGTVAGTIRVDGRLFTLAPRREGLVLAEWDEAIAPRDADPVVRPNLGRATSSLVRAAADGGDARLDVLVVYTEAAAAGAGGPSALAATVELAVAEMNASLRDSGVAGEVALMAVEPTSYDEAEFNFNQTLSRLATPGDGHMDDAVTRRDALGADHVVLIVDFAETYAGIGFQMTGETAGAFAPLAYSVVSRDYAAGFYTFAHELGHNLGAHHDEAHAGPAYRADSRGLRVPEADFRTIMAYGCDSSWCPRVGRWSSPEHAREGVATGVLGAADNAATLRDTMAIAARFRDRPAPPPPPLELAVLLDPADGATLPAGAVSMRWSDVGADEHFLMVGRAPGDDAYFGEGVGAAVEHVVDGLPEDGSELHVRVWTRHGETWGARDHVLTAHTAAVSVGAEVGFPLPGSTLPSSWSFFAWRAAEGARGYRLELGTAAEPGRYYHRELGAQRFAVAAGLPSDGSEVVARLSTLGDAGWTARETRFVAWTAPADISRITSPVSGSSLASGRVFFACSAAGSEPRWLAVRDDAGVLAFVPVYGEGVWVDGLPTDGRALTVVLYSHGPSGWTPVTASYRAAAG